MVLSFSMYKILSLCPQKILLSHDLTYNMPFVMDKLGRQRTAASKLGQRRTHMDGWWQHSFLSSILKSGWALRKRSACSFCHSWISLSSNTSSCWTQLRSLVLSSKGFTKLWISKSRIGWHGSSHALCCCKQIPLEITMPVNRLGGSSRCNEGAARDSGFSIPFARKT